jgi:hypothetical protein
VHEEADREHVRVVREGGGEVQAERGQRALRRLVDARALADSVAAVLQRRRLLDSDAVGGAAALDGLEAGCQKGPQRLGLERAVIEPLESLERAVI